MRRPATPIPAVEPTRREARLMVLSFVAFWGLVLAAQWVSLLALVPVAIYVWQQRTLRAVLRRAEPDAGWGRTWHAMWDARTHERFERATGWPRLLVRGVIGVVFVAALGVVTWDQWIR